MPISSGDLQMFRLHEFSMALNKQTTTERELEDNTVWLQSVRDVSKTGNHTILAIFNSTKFTHNGASCSQSTIDLDPIFYLHT